MYSFRTRLLVAMMALLLIVQLATTVTILARVRAEFAASATANMQAHLQALNRTFTSRFESVVTQLGEVSRRPAFEQALADDQREALGAILSGTVARLMASFAVVLDERGAVLAGSQAGPTPEMRAALQGLVSPVLQHEGARHAHHLAGLLQGRPYRVMLVPAGAAHAGWLAAGFVADESTVARWRDAADFDISLLARDPNGTRFVASTLPPRLRGSLGTLEDTPLSGELPTRVMYAGMPYLMALLPFPSDQGRIRVIAQLSLEGVEARYERMRLSVLGFSALALLGAGVLVLLIARRALRPIDELMRAAQRIEKGDYGEAIQVRGGREFEHLAAAFESMQERIAQRESRIVHQARHDALTGLPNRIAARARLTHLLAAAPAIGVVLLDLREFKDLNASFGHELGDQVLREVSRRLAGALRPGDYVARLGTDQFLLLLPGNGVEQAQATADQVVRGTRQNLLLGSIEVHLDAHAGICAAPHDGVDVDELLRRADLALQEAKKTRNPTCRYHPDYDASYRKRLRLLTDLHGAIASDQLHLVYQPKVLMADRRVRSLEALVRWNHPQLGAISPAEFVPMAEHTGSMGQLTRWVLSRAIAQLAAWREVGVVSELAVNLSASDLADAQLPDEILTLLARHGVQPQQLLLEITESAVMRELEQAVRVMGRLRSAGVRFAIDDFGTGHSSLAQLKALPVDELKIDRTFVRELQPHTRDDAIVRSAVELAHILGLKVVAEGIESATAWTALLRLGCDYAQGYFISPPLRAEQVGDWVREANSRLSSAESGTAQVRVLTELRSTRKS